MSLAAIDDLGLVDTSGTDGVGAADDDVVDAVGSSVVPNEQPERSIAVAARYPAMRGFEGRVLFMSRSSQSRTLQVVGRLRNCGCGLSLSRGRSSRDLAAASCRSAGDTLRLVHGARSFDCDSSAFASVGRALCGIRRCRIRDWSGVESGPADDCRVGLPGDGCGGAGLVGVAPCCGFAERPGHRSQCRGRGHRNAA